MTFVTPHDLGFNDATLVVGWLWWAAGPYWGDYIFTIEPQGTSDRPQMALLKPYLF